MYENIEINRRNTIPLYQQVKEQIKYSILLGQLKSGEKLPPIRVLASHLHLNPNTISHAYDELEREGLIMSRQGSGAFVTRHARESRTVVQSEVMTILDRAIHDLNFCGFSPEELTRMFEERLKMSWALPKERMAFVECHDESLRPYVARLEQELNQPIRPVLLRDLTKSAQTLGEETHVIITTFFHLAEVSDLVSSWPQSPQILAVAVMPHLRTLMSLSHFPSGSCLGVVCYVHETAQRMQQMVAEVLGDHISYLTSTPDDPAKIQQIVHDAHKILVTPDCRDAVLAQGAPVDQLLEFANELDPASIQSLRQMLYLTG